MDAGLAEVESERVDVVGLIKQTATQKIESDRRAFKLVYAFLRRFATATVIKV